jgi:hypothetical protein
VAAVFMVASMLVNTVQWLAVTADPDRTFLLTLGGTSSAVFVFALLLWLYADKFARVALTRPTAETFESDLDERQWKAVGFSIVGISMVCTHVLAIGRLLLVGAAVADDPVLENASATRQLAIEYLAQGFGALIGVVLLFGASGLAGLLHRFRYGNAPRTPADPG